MKGAVLAIGDELTCGYQLDTNSQVISQRLATVPIEVVMHVAVGDDPAAIEDGLRITLRTADVLVVTGGLGPTEDDLTRQVIAATYGRRLLEDAEAVRRMEERFAARGRTMPARNRIQAQVPAGSEVIQNDRGTAAGFYLSEGGKHIFVVPGVPFEMEGMLEDFIIPRLRALVGAGHYTERAVLKIYGLPESEINERIRPLMARGRNPLLGLLPHMGTITVEIVASATTPAEALALVQADIETLRSILEHHIISEDGRDLSQVVADLLLERGLTVAVAEVGTGGLLAARLTEPEGYGRWFRGGQVATVAAGAPGDDRGEMGAIRLAQTARAATGAHAGLGIGPVEATLPIPNGQPRAAVWTAVDLGGEATARQFGFSGGRTDVREWAADAALGLLRLRLLGVG